MKTSVIDVHAMLSVLSVDEVEKRIGEVPGVESVTVNFAASSATVRYDETRLDVVDIKSAVRQRGHAPDVGAVPEPAPGVPPQAASAPKEAPVVPPVAAVRPAPSAAPDSSEGATPKPGVEAMPAGMKMPEKPSDAPKTDAAPAPADPPAPADAPEAPSLLQRLRSWVAPADAPAEKKPAAPTPNPDGHQGHQGHATPGGGPSPMSKDMAQEMGHGGNMDLPTMVRDMRNRFWICLVFTIPIFIYSPMGNMFRAPTPPFGIPLNQWLFGLASAAVVYPSWPFFVSAWRGLRKGTLGMAALIVLSDMNLGITLDDGRHLGSAGQRG